VRPFGDAVCQSDEEAARSGSPEPSSAFRTSASVAFGHPRSRIFLVSAGMVHPGADASMERILRAMADVDIATFEVGAALLRTFDAGLGFSIA